MSRFVVGLLALCASACVNPSANGTCVDDLACVEGTVCAFGLCVDANDARLGTVDVEIEPVMSSGLPVQSLFDVDATDAGDDRVAVSLARGVSLSGNLIDNVVDGPCFGEPAVCEPHSALPAFVQAKPSQSIAGRVRAPSTTSDGGFQLLTVEGVGYRLSVTPDDSAIPPLFGDAEFADNDDLVLDNGLITVRGHVVAGVGVEALPVVNVEVLVSKDGRRVSSLGRTDVDGSFSIALRQLVSGANFEVRSSAENTGFPSVTVAIDIATDDVDLGEISLGAVSSPVPVRGNVKDRAGSPARGALVTFRGLVGAGLYTARATADESGAFNVALLPGDYLAAAVAAEDDRAGLLVQSIAVAGSIEGLALILPSRVDASVRVTTNDGVAVSSASVVFQRVGDVDGLAEPVLEGAQPLFLASADVEGNAVLAVDEGRYRVTLQPPRGSGAPAFSALVTVDGTFVRDFVLPPQNVLAGVVTDDDGAAAPGSFIRVFSKLTDELGRAIFLGEAIAGDDGSFAVSVPDLSP
ncbi:MAG: hypothetical protein Q8O67_09795 [Deltaproteobacteria bacterium]|nr:hypothetical protein [Deltaproteobacteria bacterium]